MHIAIFRKSTTTFSLALPFSLPTPSFLLKIILLITYTFLFYTSHMPVILQAAGIFKFHPIVSGFIMIY
jgi:hypothetical protein